MPDERSLKDITRAQFRANPRYRLLTYDRLPEPYAEAFAELEQDPDFYGVLWPTEPDRLSPKAVCQDTALLFFTLQEPGPLPSYVLRQLGDQGNQELAQLVLDGVLEIASGESETFVSGADAYEQMYQETFSPLGQGRVAELSRRALVYAQALPITQSARLSARLYFYNTIPVSPLWRRRFSTREAVARYLGIHPSGPHRRTLESTWVQMDAPEDNAGWLIWHSRRQAAGSDQRLRYKLYVSPRPEALPEVWPEIVAAFAARQVRSFKVGNTVYGLLRPDKIVAYCARFEELAALADQLEERLASCPAQGVPFTAGIDPLGLLSWGTDPPHDPQTRPGLARESWRLWVTNRLAVALLAARSAGDEAKATVPPWRFALERLRLEGIDIATWTPRQAIWQQEGGA